MPPGWVSEGRWLCPLGGYPWVEVAVSCGWHCVVCLTWDFLTTLSPPHLLASLRTVSPSPPSSHPHTMASSKEAAGTQARSLNISQYSHRCTLCLTKHTRSISSAQPSARPPTSYSLGLPHMAKQVTYTCRSAVQTWNPSPHSKPTCLFGRLNTFPYIREQTQTCPSLEPVSERQEFHPTRTTNSFDLLWATRPPSHSHPVWL